MDFIKTLKKKTEAKIADIKSDFSNSSSLPKCKPDFDYKSLNISTDIGPQITEYFYDMDFDLRDYLKKYNLIYPCTESQSPSFVDLQFDSLNTMRKLLLDMPVVETVAEATKTKKSKLHSHQPVKEVTLDELYYCNDLVLFRFLRTFDYKPEKSLHAILKTLSWRRTRDPLRIKPEVVHPVLYKNLLYRRGYDYYASPILYFRPINETEASLELHVLGLYYVLERALQTCLVSQGNDKVYVIVDLKDWSLSRLPPMELVIETARALVDHYTETIDEIIFIDPPPLIDPVYQMVKCVIPASTTKKLLFKSRGPKLFDYLRSRIPLCFLEKSLGGECEPEMDFKDYWKVEEAEFTYFQRRMDDKHKNNILTPVQFPIYRTRLIKYYCGIQLLIRYVILFYLCIY
ncbi:uncharacterized protein TA08980 [Theileria annulata]|uniref:CRAL/TRIO domain containing protein, putative n=1 Tax=Theileria annulata TaxID=5874 RepID=Q4U9C9_THEAN|nr:uncharacterized protein TA08980 [Theileria annulata]CAI76574.1 hypothetical protein, conserved [Theileria annulata]|eukprot:XP_953199.1 hypothetical protein, conserved [Theileria annulata]